MNQIKILLLIMLAMPVLSLQAAGNDRAADRTQLKNMLHSIEESLNNKDMDRLLIHFDDQAIVSFMTTEVATGKSGIVDYYNKMFNSSDAPLKSYHTTATLDGSAVFHGDTITASGRTQDVFNLTDGSSYQFDTRWVTTVVKKEGQWKVVALDFSVNPFDNVVLDEFDDRFVTYIALAFIAGLFIMFLIGRLWQKNAARKSTPAA